jgi:two-component system, OmpR family, response regulator
VLIARLLPLARTFISVPARRYEVGVWRFIALTVAGCALWSATFVLAGGLGASWAASGPMVAVGDTRRRRRRCRVARRTAPLSSQELLKNLSAFCGKIRGRMNNDGKPTPADALRVLVVDDEENIADLVSIALRYEGFEVRTAGTGKGALEEFDSFRPHIIVLDVMLPDLDGFDVARRLAARRQEVPILFLTARDTTEDKIRGLTLGGDDYVTKPFSVEELVARIRTILRRAGAARNEGRLRLEDLELDEDTREVFRGEDAIELTDTEFRLLRYLMLNPRRVLSRSQILDQVWEYDFRGDARVLETYISYLRKKVDNGHTPLIHTVRGVGYSLRAPK